jgi:hypothetical protein
MVDLTTTRAQDRGIVGAINHEGMQQPAFAMASQNLASTTTLLNNLHAPSADRVDRVYRQLKEILYAVSRELPPTLGRGLNLEPRLL